MRNRLINPRWAWLQIANGIGFLGVGVMLLLFSIAANNWAALAAGLAALGAACWCFHLHVSSIYWPDDF